MFNERGKSLLDQINLYLVSDEPTGGLKWPDDLRTIDYFSSGSGPSVTQEELNTKIIDQEKFILQSNYDQGIEIYNSKRGFTLKQFLDYILHFENLDRKSGYLIPGNLPNLSNENMFYNGLEKVGPISYNIVWTN